MKGKLHLNAKKEWVIQYTECQPKHMVTEYNMSIPLHKNDQELMMNRNPELWDGKEVEFEISTEYIDNYTNQTQKYAKQISVIPFISDDFQIGPDGAYEHIDKKEISWDELFNNLEAKLDIYIPIRAINYIKNKYKNPIKK